MICYEGGKKTKTNFLCWAVFELKSGVQEQDTSQSMVTEQWGRFWARHIFSSPSSDKIIELIIAIWI